MKKTIYSTRWDLFYKGIQQANDKPLWDVDPSASLALDLPLLLDNFDPKLPLVDFGCGNGLQSNFLSNHFHPVIGLDVSEVLITQNKAQSTLQGISFEVFDGLDEENAKRVHERIGDANVYVRGVLHQIRQDDRPDMMKSLMHLIGNEGCLFILESLPNLNAYFEKNSSGFSTLPLPIKKLILNGLPPLGLSLEEAEDLVQNSTGMIIDHGETVLHTNLWFQSGVPIEMPSHYYFIKKLNR